MGITKKDIKELDQMYKEIKKRTNMAPTPEIVEMDLDALDDIFRDVENAYETYLSQKVDGNEETLEEESHGGNQKFEVVIETGEVLEAELLSVVEIDGKEYAVYSIPSGEGKVDILASYVVKDAQGYDTLLDITDPVDKKKISNFIKNMAGGLIK